MIPKRITGTTNVLGAPLEWDAQQNGRVNELAIRRAPYGDTVTCESAWEPLPHELALLNAGGSVILRVVGGQPPVALYVEALGENDPNLPPVTQ